MKINDVVAESQRRALEQGAEFGAYYYEQLAQQVFDQYPNLNNEDNILNFGYAMAKEQLGKRADGIFRDEDFPGDFVSAYFWLKKQKPGVAEGLTDTQKKIEDTILKLEQRLKFAKTPEQWDNIKDRIERLQAGLNRSKQGVAEMDSQGYTGTRDPVSKSTYGSRDKGLSSRGPEKTGKALTAKQAMDKAHKAMMKSMSNDEKVDKGWRNPNVDEGVESWSSNPSDRRHPGHESYMTPEYMLAHYKKRLAQIAAGKHKYPKEVAQLQAKIAKLEKPGMSESTGNK